MPVGRDGGELPGGAAPICNPGGGSGMLVKSWPTCKAGTLGPRQPRARRGLTGYFGPAVLFALLRSTNGGRAGGKVEVGE